MSAEDLMTIFGRTSIDHNEVRTLRHTQQDKPLGMQTLIDYKKRAAYPHMVALVKSRHSGSLDFSHNRKFIKKTPKQSQPKKRLNCPQQI